VFHCTALARCRQLGAVLAAARLDRIARRAHTLSQLLEDGYSIRDADMPGATARHGASRHQDTRVEDPGRVERTLGRVERPAEQGGP
jgi:hypothetical protein